MRRHWNRWVVGLALCDPGVALAQDQVEAPGDRSSALIRDLQADDRDVRRAAAIQVQKGDRRVQQQALPVLIESLLKEKDGQVRLAVLDAVTALGPAAEPAVPALVQTMRTSSGGSFLEETHQDYRSALALAAIGEPAVAGLRGLLTERKESVRAETIMSLGRIGPAAAPAVPALIPLLGDKSERVQREVALALGRIGPAAIEPLLAIATDPGNPHRAWAIEGLGQLAAPPDPVVTVVLKAATDESSSVRAAAVQAIARFPLADEALSPIIPSNLRHNDETVRLAMVNLLTARRGLLAQVAPDLEALLDAEDEGVARHAAFLLRVLGTAGAPRLLRALAGGSSRIDPIAAALAEIGRPVVPLLDQALGATDLRVRRGAALALGQVRPLVAGVVPKLIVGLSDPDPAVRADFLAAIGWLGSRGGEAVPAVRTLLADNSAEIRLRVITILARAAPRDDRLLADLAPLIADPAAKVQERAITVLRSLGPVGRKALPGVVAVLTSPDAAVRLPATEFVESHGFAAIEAIPALTVLLADPIPQIRTIAARTLGKLGRAAQPAFAPLAALLEDDRVEVREVAALALGNLELDVEVVKTPLARALRDEKNEVRRAAMKSVQRLGPSGAILIPDLIPLATSKENIRAVDRLLRTFEQTGPDPRSIPDLIKLLTHDQVAARLQAIKFLGLAGPPARESLPALELSLTDPNAEVRRQAKTACEQIKSDPAPARQ